MTDIYQDANLVFGGWSINQGSLPTCYLTPQVFMAEYDGLIQLRPRAGTFLAWLAARARIVWVAPDGKANLLMPCLLSEAGMANKAFPVLTTSGSRVQAILDIQKGNPNWYYLNTFFSVADARAAVDSSTWYNLIYIPEIGADGLEYAQRRIEHLTTNADVGTNPTLDLPCLVDPIPPTLHHPQGDNPICFLDVDGVLVCRDPERIQLVGWAGSFLDSLERVFDIVWCTAWADHANALLYGLNVVGRAYPHVSPQASEVLEYTHGGRDWIWVQDGWSDTDMWKFRTAALMKGLPESTYLQNLIHVKHKNAWDPTKTIENNPFREVIRDVRKWIIKG